MSTDRPSGYSVVVPTTRRGVRTRERLKSAAREVLSESGYQGLRVADIIERAEIANGTFYRYFRDKDELVLELLRDLLDVLVERSKDPGDARDPRASVRIATQNYFTVYRENASLFAILAEVAQYSPEVEQIWWAARQALNERILETLNWAREQGLLQAGVDTEIMAPLLGGMAEFAAHLRFNVKRYEDAPLPAVVEQIVCIWQGVLRLPDESRGL